MQDIKSARLLKLCQGGIPPAASELNNWSSGECQVIVCPKMPLFSSDTDRFKPPVFGRGATWRSNALCRKDTWLRLFKGIEPQPMRIVTNVCSSISRPGSRQGAKWHKRWWRLKQNEMIGSDGFRFSISADRFIRGTVHTSEQ